MSRGNPFARPLKPARPPPVSTRNDMEPQMTALFNMMWAAIRCHCVDFPAAFNMS
ncbi:MAG: hypothetical protein CAPSK01_004872 [Candidatus Accumulibacter vicinus]|uniref:Uncharacterized protein n=1 Tax=Candidatus Accumulibacter vicinus TaxID=2954382 RepID=A0A084XU85_9PROT|nr:MAG: hypothetical protein CAPSK01_004872 [Candidatus Accumulibacter vicinus]